MKKIYFLFTLLISVASFGQGSIDFDTDANWSPAPSGYGNYTYTDGTFTATGVDVFRNATTAQDGFPGAFGTYSVRIRNNTSTSLTMIVASGGVGTFTFKARRWDGSPATNFAVETTTDNGANWNASSVIDATITTDSDWKTINGTINSANSNVGVRIVATGGTERLMVDDFTWTGFSTSCGVSFGATSYTCATNTVGDNNDGVTINIPYTGSDAGITSVTTTSGGTVGGDNPTTVANGTIIITGLSEGAVWDVVLNGGDCDGISTSGAVPAAECDPIPNTCFDISGGAELFELVVVTPNSSGSNMGTWTENAGTYSANAYCGSGCVEPVESWLVFGPLDMTSVTDLSLAFDANEQFSTTDLVVAYTSAYSGCPSGTTWTTAQTITDTGAVAVDISAATGTDVFVGIQYADDGADGYSNWSLSNVALNAFGNCPQLGQRPTSSCIVCDVTLGTETYTCTSNTAGANNDTATVEIPYTGLESNLTSVTTASTGTVGGDDPALVSGGTITITGLSEGDAWDITLNGGDCDGTTISGTIPATQCDPVFLVINEFQADPDATNGDANGDGTVSTTQDEFVEIYNTSASDIDLTGYIIADAAADKHVFPAGSIITANGFMTVFGGGTPTNIDFASQVASAGSLGLNNGGDTVTLKNAGGTTLTSVTYGSEGGNNHSLAREPDFTGAFVEHTLHTTNPVLFSPGAKNDGTALSVDSFEANSFKVYPNPTSTGFVTISSTSNETIKVSVFDILGKQVINTTVINSGLNVSNLNSGIYILKLTQNNASTTKKLVIK